MTGGSTAGGGTAVGGTAGDGAECGGAAAGGTACGGAAAGNTACGGAAAGGTACGGPAAGDTACGGAAAGNTACGGAAAGGTACGGAAAGGTDGLGTVGTCTGAACCAPTIAVAPTACSEPFKPDETVGEGEGDIDGDAVSDVESEFGAVAGWFGLGPSDGGSDEAVAAAPPGGVGLECGLETRCGVKRPWGYNVCD